MRRLGVALIGLVLGGLVGWVVPAWIYPWDQMTLTSLEPEQVGLLFQIFGACLGGPIGFYVGAWLARRWMPRKVLVRPAASTQLGPQKVKDNLS
jgi:membrane protein YqaA with SNARE-associated domain